MKVFVSERRSAHRCDLTVRLCFRVLTSPVREQSAFSVNVSESGVFFATRVPLRKGTAVQLRLTMPQEITGKPATEWRCTGRVVRVQPLISPSHALGIGVCFDFYEVLLPTVALVN